MEPFFIYINTTVMSKHYFCQNVLKFLLVLSHIRVLVDFYQEAPYLHSFTARTV